MRWRWAVLVLALAALAVPAGADTDFGATVWPPEDHREADELHDLLDDVLAPDGEPLRLDERALPDVRLARLDETTSTAELRFPEDEGARNRTLRLSHRPAPTTGDVQVTFGGDQLPLATHISRGNPIESRLETPPAGHVRGPPTAFAAEANASPRVQATAVADRWTLPEPGEGSIENVTWERSSTSPLLSPMGGVRACVTDGAGNCSGEASFALECEPCFTLERHAHPTPSDEIAQAWPEGPAVATPVANEAWFTFDGEDRLVAARAVAHVDLNVSALLGPPQAQRIVEDELAERGYQPVGPGLDGLALRFDQPGFDLDGARYEWFTAVVANDTADPAREHHAHVDQDPRTGNVTGVDVTPVSHGAEGGEANASGALATPLGSAIAGLALAAAAAAGRSGRSPPTS